MKRPSIVSIVLVLVFSLVAAIPARQSGKGVEMSRNPSASLPAGDFYMLAIAINDYVHWPKLRSPVPDAEALVKVLVEQYGLAPQRVTKLYNAKATETKIIGVLRTAVTVLRPEDALLIYYGGHGYVDELTDVGTWVPVDAARDDPSGWIDHSKIRTYMKKMKARHVLLISDSCFAGDFFAGQKGTPQISDAYICKAFQKTSREAITSGALEPVQDTGFGEHSVFAHFLVKTLRDNSSPYLLPSEIHDRIKGGVAANAPQQPIWGPINQTGNEPGGSFVFFRKGHGSAQGLNRMIEREQARKSSREKERDAKKLRDLETRLAELEAQKASREKDAEAAKERERRERQAEAEAEKSRRNEEAKAERDREYRAALAMLKSLEGYRPRVELVEKTGQFIYDVKEDHFIYHNCDSVTRSTGPKNSWSLHYSGYVTYKYEDIEEITVDRAIWKPCVKIIVKRAVNVEADSNDERSHFTGRWLLPIYPRRKEDIPRIIEALEVLRKGR
ncbi:MAG: caspase family protein [Candidatus Coatesbacteria bacterium]|nr:caspase family protein [Candidatus Coatesbacteria bacterium]